jgi:DNA-binding GntR family transcriptional regulator
MRDDEINDSLGPLARVALRHNIVKGLLKGIILRELPAGSRLIASKLANRFGVSATPIREALVVLAQLGVVDLHHHRGALVSSFGRPELQDFYAVRSLFESEAARLACGKVDPEILNIHRGDLERIVAGLDEDPDAEKWVKEFLAADQRVHSMLVENCGNKRLVAEIGRYNTLGETLRDLMEHEVAGHLPAVSPLMEMLDAMQNHHSDSAGKAALAMGRHINIVAEMAEAMLFDGES